MARLACVGGRTEPRKLTAPLRHLHQLLQATEIVWPWLARKQRWPRRNRHLTNVDVAVRINCNAMRRHELAGRLAVRVGLRSKPRQQLACRRKNADARPKIRKSTI